MLFHTLQETLKPLIHMELTGDIMKFKIFSMLFILGVLSVLPMIYMGHNPLSIFSGFGNQNEIAKLKAKAPKNLTNVVTDEKVQLYKWRDEHGVMQFSNTPPPATANAEKVELNPNKNLVQAINVPEPVEQKPSFQTETPNPYSVQGMKKVMDDARGVEELLRNRHEQQQKMLNGM